MARCAALKPITCGLPPEPVEALCLLCALIRVDGFNVRKDVSGAGRADLSRFNHHLQGSRDLLQRPTKPTGNEPSLSAAAQGKAAQLQSPQYGVGPGHVLGCLPKQLQATPRFTHRRQSVRILEGRYEVHYATAAGIRQPQKVGQLGFRCTRQPPRHGVSVAPASCGHSDHRGLAPQVSEKMDDGTARGRVHARAPSRLHSEEARDPRTLRRPKPMEETEIRGDHGKAVPGLPALDHVGAVPRYPAELGPGAPAT